MTTKTRKAAEAAPAKASAKVKAEAFSFGDPEPVLNPRSLLCLDYIESWSNGRWYEPPISLSGLARSRHASPHHASAMNLKVNLLTESFVPHALFSREAFRGVALDFVVLANGYLERKESVTGRALRLERSPAKYTRRGVDPRRFFYIAQVQGNGLVGEHEFEPDSVFQLAEPDLDQEIYGIPEYIAALQSAWLNEAATIFRRRYYLNGSHAGFILYSTDAQLDELSVSSLRQALKDSKGPGNFRNLFLHAPGGKKEGLQLIPVSEVAAKDEFTGIKNTSRDDILAAHRVPPQLLGIVPTNTGGFGDVSKAADVFHRLEIAPLQAKFLSINDWLGQEVVQFRPYEPLTAPAAANDAGAPRAA